ncbi:MAG: F0F1 ATP synthase subunit B [Actinomycetota bacterium]|nr:F0F1 ATP synthase subunit B [Actinomycetota bacterium]
MRRIVATILLAGMGVFGLAGAAAAQEKGPKIPEESKHCIEKLEKGGALEECQEAPSPIMPEPKEIVWQSLSFIVLLGLLWKFAYPSVKKTMEARADRIRENLDEADRVKSEAHTILEEYQRQLADAKNESNRIIEEARQTADQLRKDLVQRAEAEVGELRQRAQDDIRTAQERATADLQARVGALAIELAEKVVESSLDREANMRLIESYIQQVSQR